MRNNKKLCFVLVLVVGLSFLGCRPSEDINTRNILHANINVSDFEASSNFYVMLGFTMFMEVDIVVPDYKSTGLGLPPYTLHASPMGLSDGYVIDLIRWTDPYLAGAPYTYVNHLGLSRISLKTTDIVADIAVLTANGIVPFSAPVTINRPVPNSQLICFTDPDGTLIELVQPGDVVPGTGTPNPSGTYVTGALQTNVNCSDLDASRLFYERLGFVFQEEVSEVGSEELAAAVGLSSYDVRAATMTLPKGHSLNLTQWNPLDTEPPYASLNHLGIPRFAILTANLDVDIQTLEAHGVEFYSEPIRPDGIFGILRYVCFEDPDGTVVELVQYF